jgi:translation initiation factor IF-2
MMKKIPQTSGLIERPPIVVIMGHIDHGKSTLLDYIRKTNIVAGEAGGITQHLSAYEVTHKAAKGVEKRITFLDTPGHEAFKGMRARGAHVADIAVLVVSAEDGVKAQTLEAYKSIKEAAIPFIVAINKIDRPNANVDLTKQTLAEAEIYVEGYGGEIPWVAISAKTGEGIPELLDVMLLVAEMAELKADSSKPAEGVVIESHMDSKKGVTATIVITDGTLKRGEFIVADRAMAPVRMMENFMGAAITDATFSTPISIAGWNESPTVGTVITGHANKKDAEEAVNSAKRAVPVVRTKDENNKDTVIIPLILKTDVAGTLEAIEHEIGKLKHERVKIKIIQKGVGPISESDIKSALGSTTTLVVGFHTKADAPATDLAARIGVSIYHFDIIYKLTEWLQELMNERAPHVEMEENMGQVRVLRFFSKQKEQQVIGGRVEQGKIVNGARFKIMRRDAEIGEGRVTELQQQKIKSPEVQEGTECGMMVESKFTIAERDVLVPYSIVKKQ